MLITGRLRDAKLFSGPSLEHLEEALSVEVNRVDQVDGVVDESLLDHIIEEGVARERWTGIDL